MRRALLLAGLVALVFPAAASAIVNGTPVPAGAFPAQGSLGIDTDSNGFVDTLCAGTLVGSRQFLTAARCVTNSLGQARSPARLTVRIGQLAAPTDALDQNVAVNDIPDPTEIPPDGYVKSLGENDVAMLTLKAPVYTALTRVVDLNEPSWTPGTAARVLGWGETAAVAGDTSDTLRQGTVVIRPDSSCGTGFDASTSLCAAGTAPDGTGNPCRQDSGSPLLVPVGDTFALAGVFSGTACATAAAPGHFARVGDNPLSAWVHARTPEANFDFEGGSQPRAGEPFALVSTSHPALGEPDNYFTTVRWDLDRDGQFDDATGRRIVMTVGAPGEAVVGIEASRPGGDRASAYFTFDVVDSGAGTTPPPPAPTPTPAPVSPRPAGPLATILVSGKPRVRHRRFHVRARFAQGAPRGIAVLEVYRNKKLVGIGRVRVRRGATKRVTIRLTQRGRRSLRRAASHRLKVRIRLRVGSQKLASKRATIRR